MLFRRLTLILMLFPTLLCANGWDFRLGLANFPQQNTLLGLEVTRVLNLTENTELGIGGVIRTDFSESIGPGILTRFKYFLSEVFALGAVGEFGYMFHQRFSDPSSYSYFFVGPLLAVQVKPVFIQWEPGELFYLGTSQFMPLRLAFGLVF